MYQQVITVELEEANPPSFFSLLMEVARTRFSDVNLVKDKYIGALQFIESRLQVENLAHSATVRSISRVKNYFAHIENSLDYFNIILIGCVNSGKSSLILDLLQTTANALNDIIKESRNYEKFYDDFIIGPNIGQQPIYEFLDKKNCLRLVDIPDIDSVVHPNKNACPFVDMADCIVFLIDANIDITSAEYIFLKNIVTQNKELLGLKDYVLEDRYEKSVLVVLNKWEDAYRRLPPIKAEEIFEKKRDWILFGKKDGDFKGIAELFSEVPMVVKATTSQRDDDTGEPYFPAQIEEILAGLKNMLMRGGISKRTRQPMIFLRKELTRLKYELKESSDLSVLQALEKLEMNF